MKIEFSRSFTETMEFFNESQDHNFSFIFDEEVEEFSSFYVFYVDCVQGCVIFEKFFAVKDFAILVVQIDLEKLAQKMLAAVSRLWNPFGIL